MLPVPGAGVGRLELPLLPPTPSGPNPTAPTVDPAAQTPPASFTKTTTHPKQRWASTYVLAHLHSTEKERFELS